MYGNFKDWSYGRIGGIFSTMITEEDRNDEQKHGVQGCMYFFSSTAELPFGDGGRVKKGHMVIRYIRTKNFSNHIPTIVAWDENSASNWSRRILRHVKHIFITS